jgi:UDP-N-acetylenolpyruvoylglucosamine reductase
MRFLNMSLKKFHFELKENEEVEVVCPFCNGTMRRARKDPSEYSSLGSWFKSR